MKQILNTFQGKWMLTMAPNATVAEKQFDPHTIRELEACEYQRIPATVPGNFELDLYKAGLAPDPYFAQNPWAYQQYENRHLWYATSFEADGAGDTNTFLRFEGIDTVADIYLNGTLLGHVDNMLIEHEFCVQGLLKPANELVVHIFPTMIEARKYPLTNRCHAQPHTYAALQIRKCASMFGWDIMPRFVSGGIWKPVTLIQKRNERIEQFYLTTISLEADKSKASMRAFVELHTPMDDIRDLKLMVEGVCGNSRFYQEADFWHTFGVLHITLDNPKLWYPKNAGEQFLYDVTVRLYRKDTLCDEISFRHGVRTVELLRTSTTDKDGSGEFVFKINEKKVFCLGTNWVPLNAFPSQNPKHLKPALEMLDDLGCNMVRCWGGNVYEDDAFYDFCDERGIMIWQDFGMGCGVYPQDDGFIARIQKEAVSVVHRLRSHAALVLWAGDNENDLAHDWSAGKSIDPNTNIVSRKILPSVLLEHDHVRPYLPSSPYVDEEAFRTGRPTSEEHLWGPRDYFKGSFYGESVCHFASETGYHGCPSPASLKKFISEENVWPITDANGVPNNDWICHAAEMEPGLKGKYSYRIWLMMSQVSTLFGNLPTDLDAFAKASQISQAEAVKYFIERFRLSKWRRTGILWWNLIDGWPQISDAVVDWYQCKKLAYHYIKRSQKPLCLMFDEPKDGKLSLYAVNDLSTSQTVRFTVTDLTNGRVLYSEKATVDGDVSKCVVSIPECKDYAFLYVEWETDEGIKGSNHYITKSRDISLEQYFRDIEKVEYDAFEGFEN